MVTPILQSQLIKMTRMLTRPYPKPGVRKINSLNLRIRLSKHIYVKTTSKNQSSEVLIQSARKKKYIEEQFF